MKFFIYIFIVVIVLSVSGCAEMNRAQTGAVGGAAGGALIGQMIGKNTEATLIGAAVGTMLGYMVGNEWDKFDQQKLNTVFESGQSGQPVAWVNPDTGNKYQATPQPVYQAGNSSPVCRNAKIEAIIDGKKEIINSTACRDQNGQWQMKG